MHPDKKIKVSVITPSCNLTGFIEKTIRSVLSQAGDFFLEYIVIDGGSSDGSVEIIKKYDRLLKEGGYPVNCRGIEYRWVSEPDKGQTDALNKGFRMCRGDIVGWLNADDVYRNGALDKVCRVFAGRAESDFVYGNANFVDEPGNVVYAHWPRVRLSGREFRDMNPLAQPAVFFRKAVFDRIGILDEQFVTSMDYEFWTRAATRGCRFVYLNELLADFLVRPEAKSCGLDTSLYVENLLVPLKYFPFGHWFIRNWSRYAVMCSERNGFSLEKSVTLIGEKAQTRCAEKHKKQLTGYVQSVLKTAYLKKAGHLTETDKKKAIKCGLFILRRYPYLLFTRSSLVLLVRLIFRPGNYSSLRKIVRNGA